jgi:hypothetical protein
MVTFQQQPLSQLYHTVGGVASIRAKTETFGDHACHPERSEGSGSTARTPLKSAQVFSPNIWRKRPTALEQR